MQKERSSAKGTQITSSCSKALAHRRWFNRAALRRNIVSILIPMPSTITICFAILTGLGARIRTLHHLITVSWVYLTTQTKLNSVTSNQKTGETPCNAALKHGHPSHRYRRYNNANRHRRNRLIRHARSWVDQELEHVSVFNAVKETKGAIGL